MKKIFLFIKKNLFLIKHFDIKPDNVLFLDINESYILADFGYSKMFIKYIIFFKKIKSV